MNKPLIGITIGDPAGIGPEVAVLAADSHKVRRVCKPLLIGNTGIVERAASTVGCKRGAESIPESANYRELLSGRKGGRLPVVDLDASSLNQVKPGKLSKQAGEAAYQWVVHGAHLAIQGSIDALVTAPINKEAIRKAGHRDFIGHTELLAEMGKAKRFAMMLAGGGIRVVLVTTHLALDRVAETLTTKEIVAKTELTWDFLKSMGISTPRIGICALNPHGGEGGSFGDEEKKVISPAISRLERKGIPAFGPQPADTLFALHQNEKPFDAIVVMYHDQGLIPLKMVSFGKGVNITLGLPFIRTSPDHGTAFNLAGTGKANPGSMIEAVLTAAEMTRATRASPRRLFEL